MENALNIMTDYHRKKLSEFKESLDVELNSSHTDELLIKFLRTKNFNLKDAKKVFLENYYNRIMFGVNTILDTYKKPEVAEKYEALGILGFARDGTLIRYIPSGRLDVHGFIMSMSCHDLCLYFSYILEVDRNILREESLKTGQHISEMTYIVDLEEFKLQQVLHKDVIEMGLDFIRLIQDCYPEIWKIILVVNVPKIFDTAFSLFKPMLRSTVWDKILVVNKEMTKRVLLKYVDEDVLPAFIGGHKVDSKGDPLCREFIKFGGKIPEKFYSRNYRIPLSLDDPEVRCVIIGPRSTFNLSLAVKEPASQMRLQARTENGSLYVSALYKEFGPDPDNTEIPGEFEYLDENSENFEYKQITVEIRAQLHCTQEDAPVDLPWTGIYVLRFKNAGSWFTSRKLYVKYKIYPLNPQSSS